MRPFSLQLLQCLFALVFHHPSFLEVLNLMRERAKVSNEPIHNGSSNVSLRRKKKLTQLVAQFFSNTLASDPQDFSALVFSVRLSMISFLSRHLKYASLASQHCDLWLRSGAMGAPSAPIFGGGREACEELKIPMFNWWIESTVRLSRNWAFTTLVCHVSMRDGRIIWARPNWLLRFYLLPVSLITLSSPKSILNSPRELIVCSRKPNVSMDWLVDSKTHIELNSKTMILSCL